MSGSKRSYTRRIWTAEEDEYLKNMFADNYTLVLCKQLNRSYGSVSNRAYLFGLEKSQAFKLIEMGKQSEKLRIVGAKNRFAKGNIPVNKGKVMSEEFKEKVKHTWFKKGGTPYNTKYNGYQRISKDGYVEIRISKGKYVFKHRLIWEQQYGKIPKGYILIFRDGNKQNIVIENLQLITRKENMIRNSINRYPETLKSTIRLVHKLKKTIHAKEQN